MSEEIKKYITKIIKEEETSTGEGEGVREEVEYFVKDSEARESISDLIEDVLSITQTLGDLEEITNKPESGNTVVNNINYLGNNINSEISGINSKIGDLEEITNKPESGNTVVNNINNLYDGIRSGDEGIYYYLDNTLKPELEGDINAVSVNLNNAVQAISENIDNLEKDTIGYISEIDNSEGKNNSIVDNINRIDNSIIDVADRVDAINANLSDNKISGIILDQTGEVYNNLDENGIVNISDKIIIPSVDIKYSNLVDLRDSGHLVPGQKYRIIDYVTGVSTNINGVEYKSGRHQFDIIVEALTNKTLSEDAKACHHKFENPENDYFKNSNLSAWELKYCLDNDLNRFNWAPIDGRSANSIYVKIDKDLIDDGFFKEKLKPTGYLVINQYSTDIKESEEYNNESNPIVLVSCSLKPSPSGYNSQLCLYPELPNQSPNPDIAYFYYGDCYSENENSFITEGSYWREAYRDSEDGAWKWSSINNGDGEYLGALFIRTDSNVVVSNSSFSFSLEKFQQELTRGVIYYMKDEWENEAPFDFKNIKMFYEITTKFGEYNQSIFNADNLLLRPNDASDDIIIKELDGYWYLFSGLIVEDNGAGGWPFLYESENPLLEFDAENGRPTVSVNNDNIIDTTMYNNSGISNNTIITAQNIVKPSRNIWDAYTSTCVSTKHCYEIPRNIFLSLYYRTPKFNNTFNYASCTMCNIIEFSGNDNIFISGPGVPNKQSPGNTLGNVLSTCCSNNKFYKGVMHKSLSQATAFQTYVGN